MSQAHQPPSRRHTPGLVLPPEIEHVIRDPAFDPALRSRIERWAQRVRFRRYLFNNAKKIAKKLRQAQTPEDQRDVGVELFAARMFLSVGCSVTPEPRRAGPDLLIAASGESFYCEVARIREASLQEEWDSLIANLKSRTEPLEGSVCVQLEIAARFSGEDLLLYLVRKGFEQLAVAIRETGRLFLEAETIIRPRFVPRGTLHLRAIPLPPGSRGYFECPVDPVFFTQLEFRKLSDILCAKLRQLQPDAPNVLYIRSNSSTHAQSDLPQAIEELRRRAVNRDDAFFAKRRLTSAQTFESLVGRLSAVAFDDLWKPVHEDGPSARVRYYEAAALSLSPRVRKKLEAACRIRW